VRFWPRPLRDPEQPVTMTVWIEDTEGRRVRKAEVVVLATRYGRFRSNVATTESCFDGRAYVTLEPNVSFTPGPRGRVVLLVRAHKAGEPLLAGVSARRLVYFRVAPPTDGRDPAAPFLGCAK
jgi:hypothetical protein